MSGTRVTCVEARALPTGVDLEIESGQPLALYLLEDGDIVGSRVRSTVLRRAGADRPQDAELVFEAELVDLVAHRVLRVRRLGSVAADVVRHDGRARLALGTELRSNARVDLQRSGLPPVQLSFLFAAQGGQTRLAVGGGGTRTSEAANVQSMTLWLVPGLVQVVSAPLAILRRRVIDKLREAGVSPRALTYMFLVGSSILASGAFGITQFFTARDVQSKLTALEAEQANSEAGKAEALAAEQSCLVDRRALATAAADAVAARRAEAELALGAAAARTLAVQRGGARYADDAVSAFDAEALQADLRAVMLRMDVERNAATGAEACIEALSAVAPDLPPFLAFAHPDPRMVCSEGYVAVVEGAQLQGRWGLSSAMLTEFSEMVWTTSKSTASTDVDLRDIDRAAATLIVSGVAAAREALLTVKLPHAAVAPSELQVWSLAWFDALNRMPNASEASPRGTSGRCIADALRGIVETAPPGAPGKPVLPSVAAVAEGSVSVALTPSVACPWNTDALKAGADNALRAVARQAAWSGLQPVVEASPE